MNTSTARDKALELMSNFDLLSKGWSFGWNNRKRGFGVCKYRTKRIELSIHLTRLNPEAEVFDTIRHEIAHALAGPLAHHGPLWRVQCLVTGAKPERCYDSAKVVQPEMNYAATCGTCGIESKRNRLYPCVTACGACCKRYAYGRFDTRFVMNYYRTGSRPPVVQQPVAPVVPPPLGVLSTWKDGQYVPLGQVTQAEFTPAAPAQGTWDPNEIVRLYAAGRKIADIAVAMGYPRGSGQNRVRGVLLAAGVYSKAA